MPEERRAEIRAEEVTRVELPLQRRPQLAGKTGSPAAPNADEVAAEKNDDAAAKAASAYLAEANLPARFRKAMLTVLRQHPTETRWSGAPIPPCSPLPPNACPADRSGRRPCPPC